MKRWKLILLSICTFGIFYLIAHSKAKKLSLQANTEITYSKKVDMNILDLVETLGGKNNIKGISATISTLKIEVENIELINKLRLKQIVNKGVMFNHNQIILVLGDNAITICAAIKELP
ncbi:MAG: hypothetical protein LBV37_02605 [Mycoplasmataceae bacterium]|jgi:PTS system glucose-specific IIC component|nr:hypothetical protein [Mycoplasmataceae bacterium]